MRLIGLIIVAGVLVGSVGWASDQGPRLVQWTSAIAAVWLVGAFAAGALARGRVRAALAGAGTIVVGVATYYVLFHFVSGSLGLRYGVVVGVAWSTAGAGIGAVLGWAGGAWRRRRGETIAVALLSGALAGEAMLLLGEWHNRAARVVLACELVLGAGLPYLLARPKLARTITLTCAVAVTVLALEQSLREAMRLAGWAGA
ncbi:MAG TPA: DUF6518 family protein [Thermoleophilaceae bacterium]|jgi:hypothetical protein